MKVKRFENLWLMGLILSAVMLGAIYILKIFLPHFVIEVAHVESIVQLGHYIDTHQWAWYLATFVISYFVYFFYCCACCSKNKLHTKEHLIIVITIIALFVIKNYMPMQYTAINLISMLVLPLIFGGIFKNTVVCFSVVNLLQTLTVEIRGLSFMIIDFNFATFLILTIDVYIIEVLLYFLFNYKKEI